MMNLSCGLDLNRNSPFFSHKAFKLVLNLPSNNIHLQKDLLSSEDRVESVASLGECSLAIHDLRRSRAEHVTSALERCDTADPKIISQYIFIATCQVKYTCGRVVSITKSAAGIDQDCFYQLPCVIYFSVPSVCLDGFLGSLYSCYFIMLI